MDPFGRFDPMAALDAAFDDDSGDETDVEDNVTWRDRRRTARKTRGIARATDQFEAQHVVRGRAVSDARAIAKHESRNRDYRRVENNTTFFLEDSDDERNFTRDQRRLDRLHMERYDADGWDDLSDSELHTFPDDHDPHRTVDTKKQYQWVSTQHDEKSQEVTVTGRGRSRLRLMALKQRGRDAEQPRRFHHPVDDGLAPGPSQDFSSTDVSSRSSDSSTSGSSSDSDHSASTASTPSSSRSRSSSRSLSPVPSRPVSPAARRMAPAVQRAAPQMRRATAADFGLPPLQAVPKAKHTKGTSKRGAAVPKHQPVSRGRGAKLTVIKQPRRR